MKSLFKTIISLLSICFFAATSLAKSDYFTENQFKDLEKLGTVYMDVIHERNLIRIYLGDFQTKKHAVDTLSKVRSMGYKDAFVQ